MVLEAKQCKKCESVHIVKNGSNSVGNPKYLCKTCGFGGVFESRQYTEDFKELVVCASMERTSARGLSRVFEVSVPTILKWIKKKPSL